MVIVPLLLLPIAFAAGLWLSAKFATPLAATTTGWVAGRVVDLLVGAATAVLALSVYLAIRAVVDAGVGGFGADVLARQFVDGLFTAGVLLGAAAAVHLLAPPPDADQPG